MGGVPGAEKDEGVAAKPWDEDGSLAAVRKPPTLRSGIRCSIVEVDESFEPRRLMSSL